MASIGRHVSAANRARLAVSRRHSYNTQTQTQDTYTGHTQHTLHDHGSIYRSLLLQYTHTYTAGPAGLAAAHQATYLPESLHARYAELWTPERMDRVIQAANRNHVAIEINAHFQVPSVAFLKRAKAAGARFTLGSNQHVHGIGIIDYPLQAAREAGLTADDIFVPKRRLK